MARILRHAWAPHVLVALAAVAAFAPSLGGGFVYDDHRFVEDNPAVQESFDPLTILLDPRTVAGEDWEGIYRPLRTLSFALDRMLFGGGPVGFHVTGLLWHALASVLVLVFLRRVGVPGPAAVLAALLFAVHPVQAESVAWITSRSDVMLGALVLLLLVVHLGPGEHGVRRTALMVVILAAALLAKEGAVVALPLVVLIDVLVRRPWSPPGGPGRSLARHALAVWLPLALVTVAYLWLRQSRLGYYSPAEPFGHLQEWWGGSWPAQLVVAARGFLLQCGAVLFPVSGRFDLYPPTHGVPDLGAAIGFVIVAALLLAAWRLRRSHPLAAVGILWFLGTQFPTANVVFTVGILSADRFLYLPLVGLVLLLAPVLARRTGLTVAMLIAFAVFSAKASTRFDDDETLWASADSASPRRLEYALGFEVERISDLWDAGREEEALEAIPDALIQGQAAIQRWVSITGSPNGPRTHRRIARLHRLRGEHRLAARSLRMAAHIAPDNALVLVAVGRLRAAVGNREGAVERLQRGRDLRPRAVPAEELARARNDLAREYQEHRRYGRAVGELRRSLSEWPAGDGNEGAARLLAGLEEAIGEALARSEQTPSTAQGWLQRAIMLGQVGETEAARRIFAELRRAAPGNVGLMVAEARWANEEPGRRDEAVRGYRLALDRDPRNREAIAGLIRCHALGAATSSRSPAARLALLKLLPDGPRVLALRARILLELGRPEEARVAATAAAGMRGPGVLDAYEILDVLDGEGS